MANTQEDFLALIPQHRQALIASLELKVIARWDLTPNSGLIIFGDELHRFVAPYIADPKIRRARAGDGVCLKIIEAIKREELPNDFTATLNDLPTFLNETALSVDQTNESFILDETLILKWQIQVGNSMAAEKEKILTAARYSYLPKLFGNLYFQGQLLFSLNEFLPQTSDGWTWCVEFAKANNLGSWVQTLAELTFGMHKVFLANRSEDMQTLIHGDFHVGQILYSQSKDKFWVIDFDGDPMQNEIDRARLYSPLKDIASMVASFFHVGAIAIKNGSPEGVIKTWIQSVSDAYIEAYYACATQWDLPSREIIESMLIEHEERELAYARKFLPRWSYAPEFAIKIMTELGYGSN